MASHLTELTADTESDTADTSNTRTTTRSIRKLIRKGGGMDTPRRHRPPVSTPTSNRPRPTFKRRGGNSSESSTRLHCAHAACTWGAGHQATHLARASHLSRAWWLKWPMSLGHDPLVETARAVRSRVVKHWHHWPQRFLVLPRLHRRVQPARCVEREPCKRASLLFLAHAPMHGYCGITRRCAVPRDIPARALDAA